MRRLKTINPLLQRVIVFSVLFVAISGAIGPRIISGGILFSGGFAVYGGAGKTLLFSLISFGLLVRRRRLLVALQPWRPADLGWIVASAAALALAWANIARLLAGQHQVQAIALAHAGLILGIALLAVGCLGAKNLRSLGSIYRREIVASLALGALFYLFLLAVYALWRPLASVVLLCVRGLLALGGLHAVMVPPNSLIFDKFGITVAEYCSGIESIALFTGLYAIVGLLDWARLNRFRYFAIFPFALLALFGLNILRVYGLILAGYYINPELAFSLFHTYAGMVFFMLYSAVFWAVAYKYLITTSAPLDHKHVIAKGNPL